MTHCKLFYLLKWTFSLFLIAIISSCNRHNPNKEEWISLFNGKDLTNWDIKIAGHEINDNYKNTFVVKDSMLSIVYDAYSDFDNKFGHIYYHQPFSYYKLAFDYRFIGTQTKGGNIWNNRNSGVMLHSQSAKSNAYDQNFPVSIEFQLLGGLDNQEKRTTGNVCTPGTVVVMGDTINYNHCISTDSETYFGDRWVHAEAIVLGGESMTFIIENDTVLTLKTPQIGATPPHKKYRGEQWKKWGMNPKDWNSKEGEILSEGYIALQAESHPVDFKNIELLDLCGCKDPKAKNYKSYYVKNDSSKCEY